MRLGVVERPRDRPMEELEGWYSAAAHQQLVKSSADSGINMLRVWVSLPSSMLTIIACVGRAPD
jgi:hypothetical protein